MGNRSFKEWIGEVALLTINDPYMLTPRSKILYFSEITISISGIFRKHLEFLVIPQK